jgi:hypothetical protein
MEQTHQKLHVVTKLTEIDVAGANQMTVCVPNTRKDKRCLQLLENGQQN